MHKNETEQSQKVIEELADLLHTSTQELENTDNALQETLIENENVKELIRK